MRHQFGRAAAIATMGLVFVLALFPRLGRAAKKNPKGEKPAGSLTLLKAIEIPGHPLLSSDIAWADPGTKRIYLADRSNFAVDVFDGEKNVFVGRVTGFAGAGDMTPPPPNGQGPNGVVVTSTKKLWAGDGNSTVRVADVDPKSSNFLKVIKSIDTAISDCGSNCDRADEIAYDPEDRVIVVANDEPHLPSDAKMRGTPYATFISADSYTVLGHVSFEGATGLEQPTWIPQLHAFTISVPGYRNGGGSNAGNAEIAVLDPKTLKVSRTLKPGACHASGETLGPSDRLLVSCGGPVILNVSTGQVESTIAEIGGGDEDWYNPGDGRYYFTANDKQTPPVNSLGVIDAKTGKWVQNIPDPGGRQAVALPENNRIFTPVRATPATVKDPSTDQTTCSKFGIRGQGCIAVFAYSKGAN